MDTRLLLKQKQYELLKTKRTLQVKHSFNDPLINPPIIKKKAGKKVAGSLFKQQQKITSSSSTLNNNILSRMSKMPMINKAQKDPIRQPIEQQKNPQTPWAKILQNFLKSYDFMKQPAQLQLANAFGSYGLKIQDQLKGAQKQVKNPNQKDTRTTISIKTYLKIIELMKKDLKTKWAQDDKVGGLQIAIQACKLLHDTSNAKFHALKFAYVMEIVQQFGILVFQRIKKLSFPNLPQDKLAQITIKQLQNANIPESAQQICRNWLLKISSIRQLIPRTIIETTLLRLHFFLNNGVKAKKTLYRLAKSNRCFGQYINCIFFSTFLIRMGKQVLPLDKDYILDILDDVFFYIKQGKTKFSRQDISYDEFFNILQPFFISSFQSLSESLQSTKFKRFCQILPQNPHPVILKNFIMSFSSTHLVTYSTDIVKMLQKVYKTHKYSIYKLLLERLSQTVFPQSGQFIILAWTDISQITQIQTLLDLLGPFSEIIFRNLPRYEKNKFYSLILQSFNNMFNNFRGLSKAKFELFQKFLTGIIHKTQDIKDILTLEPFLQIISYFPTKAKQQISFSIAKTFINRDNNKIKDPVVVHIMLSLMKNLENSRHKQSQISQIALKFLQNIDFGDDIEQSLNFYAQVRASFGYIQKVTVSLIYKAAGLTFKARKLFKGRITNKLISFLQASLAYCYITVPVLQRQQLKIKMYLYLSQVALANNLISQATSLIKTCITQVSQASLKTDVEIYQIFFRIISFLIVIPDDPQKQYLFLFNGLFQAFSIAKFKSNFQYILKFQFYSHCIMYLSCQAQQRLPFHIEGVISNDALFKSIDFKKALVQKIQEVFKLLQESLKKVTEVTSEQTDLYSLNTLIQSAMSLIDVFDETQRINKLINSIAKSISIFKDKLLKKQTAASANKYKVMINGLNQKLAENNFSIKLAF